MDKTTSDPPDLSKLKIEDGDDDSIDNNKAIGHECSACGKENVPKTCRSCQNAHYCDAKCQESHWPYHKQQCKKNAPDSCALRGKVGLQNLGNTCFMNSAIQCLSHARPLTDFFISGQWSSELNIHNRDGSGGKLAKEYAGGENI